MTTGVMKKVTVNAECRLKDVEEGRFSAFIFPAFTFAVCAGVLLFYPIDKRTEIEMTNELAERRERYV
jgi:Na+/melibiose symporter-like transporter